MCQELIKISLITSNTHSNFSFFAFGSYVFSAPETMLDSVPGTLMLTDCLEQCQTNDSCSSVNYETGLCILFSSNADKLPGKSHTIKHSIGFRKKKHVENQVAQEFLSSTRLRSANELLRTLFHLHGLMTV